MLSQHLTIRTGLQLRFCARCRGQQVAVAGARCHDGGPRLDLSLVSVRLRAVAAHTYTARLPPGVPAGDVQHRRFHDVEMR